MFGYSDEDGTEAAGFPDADKLDQDLIDERAAALADLADDLVAQRAAERVGERVRVLVEEVSGGQIEGRAAHQGPEVDGAVRLAGDPAELAKVKVGDLVDAVVVQSEGVDLVAELTAVEQR